MEKRLVNKSWEEIQEEMSLAGDAAAVVVLEKK